MIGGALAALGCSRERAPAASEGGSVPAREEASGEAWLRVLPARARPGLGHPRESAPSLGRRAVGAEPSGKPAGRTAAARRAEACRPASRSRSTPAKVPNARSIALGGARHGVRQHAPRQQGLRGRRTRTATTGRTRSTPSPTAWRRPTASPTAMAACTSPRSAACSASTTSTSAGQAAEAGRGHRRAADARSTTAGGTSASAPTAAVRAGRRAVQRVRARRADLRHDPRMKPDGTGLEVFASGVRNTVGFDWHPKTRELWFTENGRDELGDDLPPDELNRAPRSRHALRLPALPRRRHPRSGIRRDSRAPTFEPPVQQLGPHAAALGMRFYTGTMFPRRVPRTRSSSPSTARGTAAASWATG